MDFMSTFPRPVGIDYCIRITVGFYDTTTSIFQPMIPQELLQKISRNTKGVRDGSPIVSVYEGFTKFVRVQPTMWDIRVDFVAPVRQAVFVSDTGIQGIASEAYGERMFDTLAHILCRQPECSSDIFYCVNDLSYHVL
jgi:hypothetical protein